MWKENVKRILAILMTLAMAVSLLPAMTLPASAAAGDTWSTQISGVGSSLNGVCYGGSTFVAVGAGGTIITSSNGTSWTDRTAANSAVTGGANLNAVCYGNSMFMAVGAGGIVITSSDGATWTASTSAPNDLVAVAYGNGAFVALGRNDTAGGYIYTSTNNGSSWSQTYFYDGWFLYGICFGDNCFLVVGDLDFSEAGKVLISTDGSTWNDHSTDQASQSLTSVCYGNSMYVACDIESRVFTSSDGTSWTNLDRQYTTTYESLDAVCYGGTTYVTVGTGGVVCISTNGTSWSSKTSGTTNALKGVCYGNSTFVAVGAGGAIITSIEAVAPNAAPVISNFSGDSVEFIEGGSAVLLDSDSNAAVTDGDSTDFNGGNVTVSITSNRTSAEDVLAIKNVGTGAGQIGVSGGNVSYGGTTIGTFAGGTGPNDLVITLNANATPANTAALLRTLTYSNTNTAGPSTLSRTVRVTVNDGDGGTSSNADETAAVIGINDAPTLTATALSPTFTEGSSAAVTLFSGASVSTIESEQTLTGLTLIVANVTDGASEILTVDGTNVALTDGTSGTTSANNMGYTVALTGNTATVTITKTPGVSQNAMQTLINGLGYKNTSNTLTAADRNITLTHVKDSGGTANGGVDTTSLSLTSTVTVADDTTAPTVSITTASTAGGDAIVNNTEKVNGFNVVAQSSEASGKLYVVPSGTGKTIGEITGAAIGNASTVGADADTTIAISANDAGVTDGISYRVYAVDEAGNISDISEVAFTADLMPPAVSITAALTAGGDATVNITEKAAGFDVIAQSSKTTGTLYVVPSGTANNISAITGAAIGSASSAGANTNTTIAISANNAGVTDGTNYVVYAIDTAGNVSVAVSAFTADLTVPAVTLVTVPADGIYKAGGELSFTVNFSEAVTVNTGGGTPFIAVTIGAAAKHAVYQSGSGSTALVFSYSVVSGDNDGDGIGLSVAALSANDGTIKDAAGNDATLTLIGVGSTTNVKVDAAAPDAPSVPDMTFGTDSGISNTDNITHNTTPTFTGTAEAGSTVTLYDTDGTTVLGSATADGSGNWSVSSAAISAGRHTVTAKAADAAGNISSASGGLAVVIDTTAPSITTSAGLTISTTAAANGATVCTLAATDATEITGFTDALVWSVTGGADMGNFLFSGAGLIISNPGGLSVGNYTVQVTATDTAGNTNTKTLTVTVVSGPTVSATSESYTDTEANDTFGSKPGTISATANSGSITGYGIHDGVPAGSYSYNSENYDVSKSGFYGTLYVKSDDGKYVYVPTSDALLNAQTATVTDTFTIEATDSAGTTGNTLTVTINGVNDTPTLAAPSAASYTDTAAADTFSSTTGTLAGHDRDSGAHLNYGGSFPGAGATIGGTDYDASQAGTYGTLYVRSDNGAYVYVPNSSAINALSASQSETFTVSVTDGALSATQTYTVSITAANDAPTIAANTGITLDEGSANVIAQANLEMTDVDTGTTSISYILTAAPANGTLKNGGTALATGDTFTQADINNGYITYTHNGSETASDSFMFTISDGTGGSIGGTAFVITVAPVNDAPTITTGAAFSVVEGATAAFTAAATDPEGSAIIWSISGGADAAKFSIATGTGAVTFITAPSFGTPTDADTNNSYILDIRASDGVLSATKTVTVTVTQRATGGSTSSGSAVVEVNGQKQNAGRSETSTNSSGQSVTTVKVDDTKLERILEASGQKPTVTLPSTGSDVTVGELNGQTVKNMEQKEATLEIRTETVSYKLPASQINIDAVSDQIGTQVELKDIKVSVKIAEPAADTVRIVEDTANRGNYQLVVKPVEFEITCTSGHKTVEVSRFNGYVERTVAIPDGVDPSKITTGIVLNADGSFSHVPTTVVVINGKYYAKINSLTNSVYSVIYNPVTFADVSSHWAKDAINDMGSRMVVAGMGDGSYEPDRSITRAEFAAIAVRALGLPKGTTESAFGDVAASDWFNGYVDTAASYALITGYDSVNYGPNDTITREQAMTILARAMKLTGLSVSLTDGETAEILAKYTDSASVSSYARMSAALCIKTGVVTGSTTTTLSPKAYVTRAEVAVMVQRLLQKSGLI